MKTTIYTNDACCFFSAFHLREQALPCICFGTEKAQQAKLLWVREKFATSSPLNSPVPLIYNEKIQQQKVIGPPSFSGMNETIPSRKKWYVENVARNKKRQR
jgi:hypothetical protein